MAGLIEHQQGITHSALIEKLHRVTQEHQAVYQQYAGIALEQKNVQNKHVVIKSQSSPDTRVNERNQKKHRRSQPRTHHDTTHEPEADAGSSGEIINIIA